MAFIRPIRWFGERTVRSLLGLREKGFVRGKIEKEWNRVKKKYESRKVGENEVERKEWQRETRKAERKRTGTRGMNYRVPAMRKGWAGNEPTQKNVIAILPFCETNATRKSFREGKRKREKEIEGGANIREDSFLSLSHIRNIGCRLLQKENVKIKPQSALWISADAVPDALVVLYRPKDTPSVFYKQTKKFSVSRHCVRLNI